jgi:hypothetical protein
MAVVARFEIMTGWVGLALPPLSEQFIIFSHLQNIIPNPEVDYLLREVAHLFCAFAPVVGIRRGGLIGH